MWALPWAQEEDGGASDWLRVGNGPFCCKSGYQTGYS